MNIVEVMEMFPTQGDCIDYLERLRWQGSPECPHCESTHVRRRNERATGRIGRYNCHECKSTFKVTHGTVFQGEPEDTTSKVVSRYLSDGKRKEKPVKLPVGTRFRLKAKGCLAYDDGNACRNGKG